ncbi:peptidoglycan-binding domain-containing protein [Streptomyces sp. TE33382]
MGPHKTESRRNVAGVGTTGPGQRQDGFEYVQLFLVELGYIAARSHEAGRLDDITALALAWFQEHSGLTPTDVFDDRTRAEMLKSRCGLMRAIPQECAAPTVMAVHPCGAKVARPVPAGPLRVRACAKPQPHRSRAP